MVWLRLLLAAGAAWAVASSAQAQSDGVRIICCKDGNRQICGDSMPTQCVGKAYRLLDRNGNVIRESDAPLTQEQKDQKQADAKRRQEEEQKLKEQRRKDQALLDTYASVDQIDRAKQRNLDGINQVIKLSEEKLTGSRKRRQDLDKQAQGFQANNLPKDLQNQMRDVDYEIKLEMASLESKRKDLQAIRERFEQERKRYLELTKP